MKSSLNTNAPVSRRARRGLGIVELGLYLIIVSLLIAAVIVAFYQLKRSTIQKQTMDMVYEIHANVKDLHKTTSLYGPIGADMDLIPVLEASEMLPPIARVDPDGIPNSGDETLKSPMGYDVEVYSSTFGNNFNINLRGTSHSYCVAIMMGFVGRPASSLGFEYVSSARVRFAMPLTFSDIDSVCAPDLNDLNFTFK